MVAVMTVINVYTGRTQGVHYWGPCNVILVRSSVATGKLAHTCIAMPYFTIMMVMYKMMGNYETGVVSKYDKIYQITE